MTNLVEEYCSLLPENQVAWFRAMSDQAIQLGFKPKRDKTKHLSISFTSNKYHVSILKYVFDRSRPTFRLKFFASKDYSPVFDLSIKKTIEAFSFKYTGCYGCGRCEGGVDGYQVRYEDGRAYYRCGSELIEIIEINEQIKNAVIELLKVQAAFYEKKGMK